MLHAASRLPLGHDEKLFFEIDTPGALEINAHLLGNPRSAITPPTHCATWDAR